MQLSSGWGRCPEEELGRGQGKGLGDWWRVKWDSCSPQVSCPRHRYHPDLGAEVATLACTWGPLAGFPGGLGSGCLLGCQESPVGHRPPPTPPQEPLREDDGLVAGTCMPTSASSAIAALIGLTSSSCGTGPGAHPRHILRLWNPECRGFLQEGARAWGRPRRGRGDVSPGGPSRQPRAAGGRVTPRCGNWCGAWGGYRGRVHASLGEALLVATPSGPLTV